MKSNYKRLGNYIRQVDVRNVEDKRYELLGVSVENVLLVLLQILLEQTGTIIKL